MPHMSSGGSEDFYSKDEVKVYKDEGEEEKRSSENLSEEKFGLVTESEEGKTSGNYPGSEKSSNNTRSDDDKSAPQPPGPGGGPLGFLMPPYYANGATVGNAKLGPVQPPYPGLVMYNDFASPPPAHMGIPPVHTDPKTGLPRPPMYATYPAPPGQFPPHLYPEFSQWHRPAGYPISTGGFSGSYPPLLNTSISRLGHPGILPHPGLPHPGMPPHPVMSPGPKQDMMAQHMAGHDNHRPPLSLTPVDNTNGNNSGNGENAKKKRTYVKKPLNAFMLFMKEMRAKVIADCTLKESAAINQILGKKWHALDRQEQSKYYDMARKEKELHLQLYPGWSARDNYATHAKKKKRKKDGPGENKDCPHAKKCRARFGMEAQTQWCKPCRRKKRCVRFLRGEGEIGSSDEDDMDDDLCNDSLAESGRSGVDSDCNVDSPQPPLSHQPQYDSFNLKPSGDKCHSSPHHLPSPFGSVGAGDTGLDEAEKALDFHTDSKLCMDLPASPLAVQTS